MLSVGRVLTRRPWRRCAKMLGRVWMRAFRSAPPPPRQTTPLDHDVCTGMTNATQGPEDSTTHFILLHGRIQPVLSCGA